MKKSLLLSFLLCFAFAFNIVAQSRTIKGKVTDPKTGEGLPGVSVFVDGTTAGTVTDVNGDYELTVPDSPNAVIVFKSVGLATQKITLGAQSTINIQMQTDTTDLGEVVVTGYRTYVKETSNIAVSSVSSENIKSRPNPSIVQTLSGQVPGLNITTASGQPGANSLINLRGVGSINGDTEPLFVIDGAPVDQDNFRALNPNEIASINVLKDAAATAIYGNRGANGVIVIETKRGGFDAPLQVTYTVQRISNSMQVANYGRMNSQQQLQLERLYGSGRGTTLTDADIAAAANTDWVDYFFDAGVGVNHNLQFSGGSKNISTYVSLGFLDQEGMLRQSDLRRYNLRTNLDGKNNNGKFTYGVNLSINYAESNEPNEIGSGAVNRNYVLGAFQSVPYITPEDYTNGPDLADNFSGFVQTPLLLVDRLNNYMRREDELKMIATLRFGYEIIDGLSVNLRGSGDFTSFQRLRAEGPESFNAQFFAEAGNETPGTQDQQFNRTFTYNQVTSINYVKTFADKHTINAGIFTEYYKAHLNTFGFRARGLNPKTFSPGDGSGFVGDNADNFFDDDANADILESGLFSYFGTVDYDYDSRFGASVTFRRDAASRFSESNRWGTYFSVAGRWNIHNEAFAANLPFSLLKLRASYGTNGNQYVGGNGGGAGDFTALDLQEEFFANGGGYQAANGRFLSQLPNRTLEWETVAQANVGIDAEVLDGRLRATVDGYIRTTSNLYQTLPISAINGTTGINANIGKIQNRGFDFQIAYDVLRSDDPDGLNITVNVLGNYNKQEILELPGGEDQLIGTGRVGGPLFEYFDYRYVGVNPGNGNLLFLTAGGEVTENPNVDTDRVWLGKNIYPDWQGSFGFNIDYKGVFVQAQFNYVIGVDRYDFDLSGLQDPTSIGDFVSSTDLERAWTPDNPVTDIPSLNADNIDLDGDRYLSSADFLRLRFLTVGYNLPSEWLEKVKLRTASVFFNTENLFTFTPWRGFDPEATSNTSRLYPTPRTWSIGLEIGL